MTTSDIDANPKTTRVLSELLPSKAGVAYYTKALLWLLFVYVLNIYADNLGGSVVLSELVRLSVMYLGLRIAFDTAGRAIRFLYRRKNKRPSTHEDSFTIGITRLFAALFWFVFTLFVIDVFIPITTLLGSITIAIAVTGLAFRDYVTNFMNGINIMFSRNFQPGEYVQIGDSKGRIKDLTFTHVHLLTESQDMVYVPNNLMLAKDVINFSKNKVKTVLVRMVVDKSNYEYYTELREHIIERVTTEFASKLAGENSVRIRVEALEKDTTVWLIEYRVAWYDFALETALKNFTAETVVAFLVSKEQEKKAGVEKEGKKKDSAAEKKKSK